MKEKLTWDEIKLRYPDEYVILAEPEHNDNEDTVAGIVLSHDPDLDRALAPTHGIKQLLAIEWTGAIHGGLISVRVESVD